MSTHIEYSSKDKAFAIFYAILISLIFVGHYFIAKDVMKEVPPLILGAARGIIGGPLIFLFIRTPIKKHINKKLLLNLVAIGFLGFFLNQILFLYGLKNTTALKTSLFINAIPIITTFLGIVFAQEEFTYKKVIGVSLGFILVSILVFQKGGDLSSISINGDLLIFLSVVSLCLSFVIAKKIMTGNMPNVLVSTGMLVTGGIMLLIPSIMDTPLFLEYTFSNFKNFSYMFYEIVISSSVTYYLNFKVLQVLAPSQSTIFIYIQPPLTALCEFLLFSIVPSPIILPIFIGILFSGYLVISKNKKRALRPLSIE